VNLVPLTEPAHTPPSESDAARPVDAILVGAGIMSATLGTLLRHLEPDARIEVFERLDRAAAESSDAWNNAGTGHSAFCELNYTPEAPDGSVDIAKALRIAEQFEVTKQLWASLVERGILPDSQAFVRRLPHVSFVWGAKNAAFLRARHEALARSPLFAGMELTADPRRIAEWAPLVMEGERRGGATVAATRMAIGTDIDFGAVARAMIERLTAGGGAALHLGHEVEGFRREPGSGGAWQVDVRDLTTGATRTVRTRFVFIGAGGYSLKLLERTGIPECAGYAAFPVSGQWLRCTNRKVIERHDAKVYGRAAVGAPPMSVPHLDTRWIGGRKELLFGPYAGFTTKFLKEGSFLDLFRSLGFTNIVPAMRAGIDNLDLTRYLVGQALLSSRQRLRLLREYYPAARARDWQLEIAGLRVQMIQNDGRGGGVLKFGTELVTSADGSVAALLGASPGASTAASIMLDLLARCFPDRWRTSRWQTRCRELIPSLGRDLGADADLCRSVRARSHAALGLVCS
jgi:malate dehydrogenase (quinone)